MSEEPVRVKAHPAFYWLVRNSLSLFCKVYFRFTSHGREHIPPVGDPRGVILAPNHASYLDPPAVGVGSPRHVTFLAKEYLFRAPIFGRCLHWLGCYPIKSQEDDFRSIRQLIRLLRAGHCVTVFPEGTRSQDGKLQKAEPGVGFLAMKSAAAVVPAYIRGSFEAYPRRGRFIRPCKVSIHFGRAFVPAEDPVLRADPDPYGAVSRRILEEIRALKESVEKSS